MPPIPRIQHMVSKMRCNELKLSARAELNDVIQLMTLAYSEKKNSEYLQSTQYDLPISTSK